MISKEDIKKASALAMLDFTDEELAQLEIKMTQSINRVEILEKVDTDNLEPLHQVHTSVEDLRKDEIEEKYILSREEVLANTKEQQYGYFKLLNIMD